jgi:invasion protein IalB
MLVSRWILISAVGGLLVSGAWVLLGTRWGVAAVADVEMTAEGVEPSLAPVREAQLRPATPAPAAPRPAAPAPAAPAPAAPAPAAAAKPQRVETTMYDSWAVTCEDTSVGGAVKRTCNAALRLVNQNQGMVLNWQIGFNPEGSLVTAIHVPSSLAVKQGNETVGGPILLANGVELKFGNGPVRHVAYVWCGPQQCYAETPIDDAFMKEAVASEKATITIHTGGATIPFELSIKGIDKAISAARR